MSSSVHEFDVKHHDPISSLVLTTFRTIVYISILALFYILAYTICDFLRLGKSEVDVNGQPTDKIVAVFAKYDSAEFIKEMARKLAVNNSIVGEINLAERVSDGRLHLVGWALDRQDTSKSLDIFMIVPQKLVFMSSTSRKRDDVADHFLLAREAVSPGFDAIFENRFDCDYNKKGPLVIAVNQTKQFSLIKPWLQVSGC